MQIGAQVRGAERAREGEEIFKSSSQISQVCVEAAANHQRRDRLVRAPVPLCLVKDMRHRTALQITLPVEQVVSHLVPLGQLAEQLGPSMGETIAACEQRDRGQGNQGGGDLVGGNAAELLKAHLDCGRINDRCVGCVRPTGVEVRPERMVGSKPAVIDPFELRVEQRARGKQVRPSTRIVVHDVVDQTNEQIAVHRRIGELLVNGRVDRHPFAARQPPRERYGREGAGCRK